MQDSFCARYSYILFVCTVMFLPFLVCGQAKFEWATQIESDEYSGGFDIAVDNNGNTYTIGVFNGVLFPEDDIFTLATFGDNDVFIAKTNESGDLLWIKQVGGVDEDRVEAIGIDTDNNLVITGYFKGIVDFDPSEETFFMSSEGTFDSFVLKLTTDGNFVWAKQIQGAFNNSARDCVLSATGDIYIAGLYDGETNFNVDGEEYLLEGDNNGFVLKLDGNGNFIWAKASNSSSEFAGLVPESITLDEDENVYLTGYYSLELDIDPGDNEVLFESNGGHDVFILKLDNTGDFVWATSIGGTSVDRAYGIKIDTEGNVCVGGSFQGVVDFDPGEGVYNLTSASSSEDGFVLKLNNTGEFIWAKAISGVPDMDVFDLALMSDNSIFIIGRFYSGVTFPTDFDPSEGVFNLYNSSSFFDAFIAKYSPSGGLEYAKTFGNTGGDAILGIFVDDNDNIFTSGYFYSIVDFDFGDDTFFMDEGDSNGDAFIHKMVPCAASSATISATACDSYDWALTGESYTESGSYSTSIDNAVGCDSIITLELTINESIILSEEVSACDSYTWEPTGLTYNSSTTAIINVSPTAAGCDSIMVLYLSINNTSSSTNVTACDSYTWPLTGATYSETGSYTHVSTNDNNCEETTTLNLTVNNSSASTENISACDSYTWPANNMDYTESGTYTEMLSNLAGCDSVVTLQLSIDSSSSGTEAITACDSYEWSANGFIYTEAGTYTAMLTNAVGCDSLATLELSINASSNSTTVITACDAYTWPANGLSYMESGVYSTILLNNLSCDSLVTLELTINTVNTEVSAVGSPILLASASTATYQWLDCNDELAPIEGATEQIYTATSNGDYAVSITSNGCTSISECVAVRNLSIVEDKAIGNILIYPNPTSASIQIISSHHAINDLSIYDVSGKEVYSDSFEQSNELTISLEGLEAGIYFARIHTTHGIYLEQLVKY